MNTTYFMNQIMGNVFNTQVSPALPAQYYLGISSSAPAIDGTDVTEPSGAASGYARKLLTVLSTPTNGAITNQGAIAFDESLDPWGIMTHYVIYDAADGGNLLMFGELKISRNIEQNTVITIKAGELVLTLGNPLE